MKAPILEGVTVTPDSGQVQECVGCEVAMVFAPELTRLITSIGALRAALSNDRSASVPVGRSGNPMKVKPGTNRPGSVNGTDYSGHAFDQMPGRGIPPSAVDNTIQTGASEPGNLPGTTAYYDPINDLTVITDTASGRVITVHQGPQ